MHTSCRLLGQNMRIPSAGHVARYESAVRSVLPLTPSALTVNIPARTRWYIELGCQNISTGGLRAYLGL
jgi:hypothetical protein